MTLNRLPHAAITELILHAFHDVVHELGCGFSEKVHQRALFIALRDRGVPVEANVPLTVRFRGELIGSFFVDLVVDRKVLIEVKAMATLDDFAKAQILNYLRAAGGGVGLLLNFGRHPESKRFVMGNPEDSLPNLRTTSEGVGGANSVEPC